MTQLREFLFKTPLSIEIIMPMKIFFKDTRTSLKYFINLESWLKLVMISFFLRDADVLLALTICMFVKSGLLTLLLFSMFIFIPFGYRFVLFIIMLKLVSKEAKIRKSHCRLSWHLNIAICHWIRKEEEEINESV